VGENEKDECAERVAVTDDAKCMVGGLKIQSTWRIGENDRWNSQVCNRDNKLTAAMNKDTARSALRTGCWSAADTSKPTDHLQARQQLICCVNSDQYRQPDLPDISHAAQRVDQKTKSQKQRDLLLH